MPRKELPTVEIHFGDIVRKKTDPKTLWVIHDIGEEEFLYISAIKTSTNQEQESIPPTGHGTMRIHEIEILNESEYERWSVERVRDAAIRGLRQEESILDEADQMELEILTSNIITESYKKGQSREIPVYNSRKRRA